MNSETVDPSTRTRTLWLSLALFLAITIGGAVARRTAGAEAVMAIACAYGLGTLAMAWLTARVTPYPRGSWFTTAGLMAIGLVASAAISGPEWAEEWQGMVWMFPWLFLVMAFVIPAGKTGLCAPGGRWAGLILVGVGMVYALLLLGIPLVKRVL